MANMTNEKIKKNLYGFKFNDLSNDDLLEIYVKSNTSVFLHGPSGVGKSARVKALDPSAVFISLRPQMNPEEVDGTLDRETGKYIPPLWYTKLCENCRREPKRKHILFIDELTNVKPTVQSLVYSIVLDRAGKDGLWKLPDNAVVVAAGNETKDNLAAFPLTNALFRRFCHIYYDVDKNDWFEWATGINSVSKITHTDNFVSDAKVHPAIVSYIMGRDDSVLNQELNEEEPKIVTDPRKWEIASHILYFSKNPKALAPAIGEELTADFVEFVKNVPITVSDVVNGNYDENQFKEMAVSQKFSCLLSLVSANAEQLDKVRSFVSKYLNNEMLATYDSMWIKNDPERAQIVAESKINSELKLEIQLNR